MRCFFDILHAVISIILTLYLPKHLIMRSHSNIVHVQWICLDRFGMGFPKKNDLSLSLCHTVQINSFIILLSLYLPKIVMRSDLKIKVNSPMLPGTPALRKAEIIAAANIYQFLGTQVGIPARETRLPPSRASLRFQKLVEISLVSEDLSSNSVFFGTEVKPYIPVIFFFSLLRDVEVTGQGFVCFVVHFPVPLLHPLCYIFQSF